MEPNLRLLGGGDGGLELGLGLNIGTRPTSYPSGVKSPGPSCCGGKPAKMDGAVSGAERAPDSVPRGMGQVVGWPPLRSYRMNSLVTHGKTSNGEDNKNNEKCEENSSNKLSNGKKSDGGRFGVKEGGNLGFVKVNMDGIPIGRKADLTAHTSYQSLAEALVAMFQSATNVMSSFCGEKEQRAMTPSKLLDGSSEFALTYEDKEGDWLLVGDVPWGKWTMLGCPQNICYQECIQAFHKHEQTINICVAQVITSVSHRRLSSMRVCEKRGNIHVSTHLEDVCRHCEKAKNLEDFGGSRTCAHKDPRNS